MKKRILLLIVLVIILFFYINTSNEVKELNMELEQMTKRKEELVIHVDYLQSIIESNNNEKNKKLTDNETITVNNMYLKKDKELYGIGVIEKEVNMQSIAITNPSSEYKIKEKEVVEIIDVFIGSDNKEWALVKYNQGHVWGLIESQYVKNTKINGYYEESEWEINGFKIGEPLSNAIHMMDCDYTISELGEYSRDLIATFKDEGETRVFFDPTFKVIKYISTTDKNITVNGLFHVGDNVYESISLLNKSYYDNEKNYVIIEDSSSYYIILYYNTNKEITSIIYRTYEVEA